MSFGETVSQIEGGRVAALLDLPEFEIKATLYF